MRDNVPHITVVNVLLPVYYLGQQSERHACQRVSSADIHPGAPFSRLLALTLGADQLVDSEVEVDGGHDSISENLLDKGDNALSVLGHCL